MFIMQNIILFDKDSPEDLILRGFARNAILSKTGINIGMHGSETRKRVAGIDNKEYIAAFIKSNFSNKEILNIINIHKSQQEVLDFFGLNGKQNIKDIFSRLGFGDEYIKARNKKTHETLVAATEAKYGVKYAMQNDAVKQKSKESCLEKYGVEHPMQSAKIQKTASQTCMNRYGVSNPKQYEEFKNKAKQTCLKNHGVEYPMQSEHIMKKSIETSLKKYGTEYPIQSSVVREKAIQTCINKYGVENVFQSEEIKSEIKDTMLARYDIENAKQCEEFKDKAKQTCLTHYGVEYPMQSKDVIEKSKQTNLIKYGYEQASKSEVVKAKTKETCLIRYGGKSSLCSTKIREKAITTCIDKYGVEYPSQSDEVKQKFKDTCMRKYGAANPMKCKNIVKKSIETKRANGTLNTSAPEAKLYEMLLAVFDKDDVFRQYNKDLRYPFCCDFYIKSRDLFIELNAFWTHGYHWYDPNSSHDIKSVQSWSDKNTDFYDRAIETWTISDFNKRQAAQDNNLNYVVFWSSKLKDALYWFELGCPDRKDWKL